MSAALIRDDHSTPCVANPPVTKLPNGVEIAGWRISSQKKAILKSNELETFSIQLGLPMLPEMVFGNNHLTFEHLGTKSALTFNAHDALAMVSHHPPTLSVATSDNWKQKNQQQMEAMTAAQPGTHRVAPTHSFEVTRQGDPSELKIPIDKLKRPDPIIWFDEVILFEDELADNGTAELSVKVRVMPSYFFLLLRFWLRVDDVLFKVLETRFYHEYGTNFLIREYIHKEETWKNVTAKITDSKKLIDANTMAMALPVVHTHTDKIEIK